MGISLTSLGGALSGAQEGFQQAGENVIARETADIAQSDSGIRQAEEARAAAQQRAKDGFGQILALREAVDNPVAAQPPMATQNPQYNAQQGGALPAGGPPAAGPPAAGPPAGGPPAAGPPAAGPPAAGPPDLAGPPATAGPPAAGQPPTTRRERYQEYLAKAKALAFAAGGFEGLEHFKKSETAITMRQMMDYGMQAADLIDQSLIGDAVRAANTALESTEFDTGLKFVAKDGKVHMAGSSGKLGPALSSDDIRAYITEKLKTPETFLEWTKQDETKRSALASEETEARRVAVMEAEEARMERHAERLMQTKEGTTLAQLIAAKTNSRRAMAAAMKASDSGWTIGQQQKVFADTDAWAVEELTTFPEVQQYYNDNPKAWTDMKEDAQYLQLEQDPTDMITRETAMIVSQLIRQPAGLDAKAWGLKEGEFTPHLMDDGRMAINKEGRFVMLTPELEQVYAKKNPEEYAKVEEKRKALGGGAGGGAGVLPDDTPLEEIEVTAQRREESKQSPPEVLDTSGPGTGTVGEQREAAGATKYGSNPNYFDPLKGALSGVPTAPKDENPYALMGQRGG